MIICLTLLCGHAKAQTRGGDSSPPLPKEISAKLFDKAVELIKEFEGGTTTRNTRTSVMGINCCHTRT